MWSSCSRRGPMPRASALAAMSRPTCRSAITADPGRVRQVLLNLDRQRHQVHRCRRCRWSVCCCRQVKARQCCGFAVTDTGPGLSETDRDRIFEEFEQADSTLDAHPRRGGPWPRHLARTRPVDGRRHHRRGLARRRLGVSPFTVPAIEAVEVADHAQQDLAGRAYLILSRPNDGRSRRRSPDDRGLRRRRPYRCYGEGGLRARRRASRRCWWSTAAREPIAASVLAHLRKAVCGWSGHDLISSDRSGPIGRLQALHGYATSWRGPPQLDIAPAVRSRRDRRQTKPARAKRLARRRPRRAPRAAAYPARRGQRDQLAACPSALTKAGHAVETSADGRAGGGRGYQGPRRALRRRADGPAHAGYGRHGRHCRASAPTRSRKGARRFRSWC